MLNIYGRRNWVLWLEIVLLAVAIAIPSIAEAKDKRELVVLTQNLYLGSSLEPAIAATDPTEFLLGVATIFGTVHFTDFPTRAAAIAEEIASFRPDLVGLQEVSNWISVGNGPYGSQDFLEILMQALEYEGMDYRVAAVSYNASIGPIPLVACYEWNDGWPNCYLTFQDRDVILVNQETPGLLITDAQSGRFATQEYIETPVGPLSFARGWAYLDGTFQGKRFRFLNTHLEEESYPGTQQAQALEFLAGPARAPGAVVAVGDFNSAADGSSTESYALLTKSYFKDAWDANSGDPGYTCCQDGTLTNAESALYERIDLTLTHAASRALDAAIVNDQPIDTAPPLWASDHSGVLSTIRLH